RIQRAADRHGEYCGEQLHANDRLELLAVDVCRLRRCRADGGLFHHSGRGGKLSDSGLRGLAEQPRKVARGIPRRHKDRIDTLHIEYWKLWRVCLSERLDG